MQVNKTLIIFALILFTTTTLALNIAIISPQNNAQLSNNAIEVNLEYDNAIENLTCSYSLNGVLNNFDCQNFTLLDAIQGHNTLQIYANDTENQTSTTTQFNLNTTPPTAQITASNIEINYITLTINTSKNALLNINYTDHNSFTSSTTTPLSTQHTVNLTSLNPNTTYYYTIQACDNFDNCATTEEQNTTTLATPSRPIHVQLVTVTGIYSNNLTLSASSTSINVTQVNFNLSNTLINATLIPTTSFWNATINTTTLTDGIYNLTAIATNDLNNQNHSTTIQITIDNNKPTLSLYLSNNSKTNSTTLRLNYSTYDLTLDKCWYTLDDSNTTLPNCYNTTINSLAQTIHNLTLYANDSNGKTNFLQINFTIDTTTPTISTLAYNRINESVNITWTTNEPTNYTIAYGYNGSFGGNSVNSTLITTFNAQFFNLEYDETYGYNVYACDASGNCANQSIYVTTPHDPALRSTSISTTAASGGASGSTSETTFETGHALTTPQATTLENAISETQINQTDALNTQTNTNTTQTTSNSTAFATAADKDNFAVAVALLSGLSILMYGYKKPLLSKVKSKNKKTKQKNKTPKPEKENNRFSYLTQINGKKIRYPTQTKTHQAKEKHVEKLKFKNGTLADHIAHSIKKRL